MHVLRFYSELKIITHKLNHPDALGDSSCCSKCKAASWFHLECKWVETRETGLSLSQV